MPNEHPSARAGQHRDHVDDRSEPPHRADANAPTPTRSARCQDAPMPLVSSTIDTPVGTLTLIASDSHLRAVLWPLDGELQRTGIDSDDLEDGSNAITELAGQQIIEHLTGSRQEFDLPIDAVGTDFQRKVWSALSDIAPGTTRTYAEHAAAIGRPEATRAVATAIGRNPLSIVVPCHRVIGADGSLTGFAGGLDAKAWLLSNEAGH